MNVIVSRATRMFCGPCQRLSITTCSWPGDSVHTPVNSKARANRRRSPALAATVLLTNLADGRGRARPRARALSDKVEAIKIHHLVPRGHKVTHELLLSVVTGVDLREGSELGVVTE